MSWGFTEWAVATGSKAADWMPALEMCGLQETDRLISLACCAIELANNDPDAVNLSAIERGRWQAEVMESIMEVLLMGFADELKLITDKELPEREKQNIEHSDILESFQSLIYELKTGTINATAYVGKELLIRLIRHVNLTDKTTFARDKLEAVFINAQTEALFKKLIKATGIVELDRGIQTLTGSLFALSEIMKQWNSSSEKPPRTLALEVAKRFHQDCVNVCNAQSAFMIRNALPGLVIHDKEHDIFIRSIETFCQQFEKGDNVINDTIRQNTLRWWFRHFSDYDAQMLGRKNALRLALVTSNPGDYPAWLLESVADYLRTFFSALLDLWSEFRKQLRIGDPSQQIQLEWFLENASALIPGMLECDAMASPNPKSLDTRVRNFRLKTVAKTIHSFRNANKPGAIGNCDKVALECTCALFNYGHF